MLAAAAAAGEFPLLSHTQQTHPRAAPASLWP